MKTRQGIGKDGKDSIVGTKNNITEENTIKEISEEEEQ